MRELNNKVTLSVSAQLAFDWFKKLDKNYIKWHPIAHKNFKWISGKPIGEGTIFSFEENIKGNDHKMIMKITEYVENQKLSFLSIRMYSKSKLVPRWVMSSLISIFKVKIQMSRFFETLSVNSTIIHTKHEFGSSLPIIGKLVDWFIDHFIFSSKTHLEHVEEEGKYMKAYFEQIS